MGDEQETEGVKFTIWNIGRKVDMFFESVQILCVANYSDLSRGHLKWWFSKGILPKCPQFSVRKGIEVFLSTGNATRLDFSRIPLGAVVTTQVIQTFWRIALQSFMKRIMSSSCRAVSTSWDQEALACEPADDGDGTMQDSKASFVFVS